MAIELFQHNQDAYTAVIQMLQTTGKAAVIHPTGAGKSFIAFKLCEDHSEKTICWLSPSSYIFKTQLENLRKAGGSDLENIRFFTYARLINMTPDEISAIQPDYIILDEFHRCGAEVWGNGVQNLLTAFPDIPVLGLSATAIRYLDNQRDMSDELFDGNIASEMTLGEAIVRGILNPPKYVLSVFSYQKDLEKYEKRVRSAKSKAVRDEGQQHLDALRRALEKADGIRLGAWLNSVRSCKKGQNRRAELTAEQMARLDALGMNWVGKHNATWDVAYAEACKYRQEHGDLNVPSSYVTESGIRLGRWIRSQREVYRTTLSEPRKKKLDALGMVWQPEDPWNAKFCLVQQYYETHGHTNMPTDYVVEGVWLRRWLSEQKARLNGKPTGRSKTAKNLTPEQIHCLSTVGIEPQKTALEIA